MAPATKATQKRLEAAVAAFNNRYAHPEQWGNDRWHASLYPALTQPTTYCAIVNQYAVSEQECLDLLAGSGSDVLVKVPLPQLSGQQSEKGIICYERYHTLERDLSSGKLNGNQLSSIPFPVPKQVQNGSRLLTHWNLDAASVLAVFMLDVQPRDRVLDMCAAPGGKSVVLAQRLFPHLWQTPHLLTDDTTPQSMLVVNEFDPVRHKRLAANLRAYLPAGLFPTPENPQSPVRILNKDLSQKTSISSIPHGPGAYDKVLIDAPCSSERHVIHAYEKSKLSGQVADEMVNWKNSHVATLVKTQTGLLQTALKVVRLGGRVVYATCALGKEENDGVIERVLDSIKTERKRAKRAGEATENWDVEFQLGTEGTSLYDTDSVLRQMTESTKYGRIALPDHGGWGPLYFSIMTKVERTKRTRRDTKEIELL